MEPRKLISSIGVVITTITAIILFFTEYDKIKSFFFPEKAAISLPFFILVVVGVGLIIFYMVYQLYYKEKEDHRRTKIQLENITGLLLDSERLRLIDFVTGIPNEQKFKLDLDNRPKELFHLILIDLDGFSEINKKQGFQKGDEVIRTIAKDLFIKMRRDEDL